MPRLRFVTYNIHGAVGMDGRRRQDRPLEVLRRIDADCVALQEFVNLASPHGGTLLEHWRESLGMHSARYAPAFMRGGEQFGNALLSRHPLLQCTEHDFAAPGCLPRVVLHGVVDVGGTELEVTVVHLAVRSGARAAQRSLLQDLIARVDGAAHVVLGDFNEWHSWNSTFRLMRERFAGGPALPTFPAIAPALALDRIWVRPAGGLAATHVDALPPARSASDHLPLVATVEF